MNEPVADVAAPSPTVAGPVNENVPLISVDEDDVMISVPLVLLYTNCPLLTFSAATNPVAWFVPSV